MKQTEEAYNRALDDTRTRTWTMIEVMLVGVLVALIKIAELATVIPGLALFVLGALVLILTWMQTTFDARAVWERVEWAEAADAAAAGEIPPRRPCRSMRSQCDDRRATFRFIRGESVVVDAVWAVRRTAGEQMHSGRTSARETVEGHSFDALAAAHSRALARLSADIAAAIREMAARRG